MLTELLHSVELLVLPMELAVLLGVLHSLLEVPLPLEASDSAELVVPSVYSSLAAVPATDVADLPLRLQNLAQASQRASFGAI